MADSWRLLAGNPAPAGPVATPPGFCRLSAGACLSRRKTGFRASCMGFQGVIEKPHGRSDRLALPLEQPGSTLNLPVVMTGISQPSGAAVWWPPTGAICCFQAGETSNSLRQTRRHEHQARRQPRQTSSVGVSCFWAASAGGATGHEFGDTGEMPFVHPSRP